MAVFAGMYLFVSPVGLLPGQVTGGVGAVLLMVGVTVLFDRLSRRREQAARFALDFALDWESLVDDELVRRFAEAFGVEATAIEIDAACCHRNDPLGMIRDLVRGYPHLTWDGDWFSTADGHADRTRRFGMLVNFAGVVASALAVGAAAIAVSGKSVWLPLLVASVPAALLFVLFLHLWSGMRAAARVVDGKADR